MSIYFRLLKYLKPYWKITFGISIIILVSAPVSIISIHITRLIINGVVYKKILSSGYLLLLVGGFGFFEILAGILAYLKDYLKEWLGKKLTADLKAQIFKHVVHLPLAFFENKSTGEIQQRIVKEVDGLSAGLVEPVVNIFSLMVNLVWAVVYALNISWKLTLLYLCVMPFRFFATKWFTKRTVSLVEVAMEKSAKFSGYIVDLLSGIREIKSYVQEEEETRRYRKEVDEIHNFELKLAHNRSLQNPTITFLGGTLGMILIYFAGGLMVMKGQILIGDLYAFISYTGMIFGPIHMFGFYYDIIRQDLVTARRVFQILDIAPEDFESKVQQPTPTRFRGHISFENVSFAYKPDREVIHDITFEVYPGQTVALVGKSGSGKTTISKLIPRFYDVSDGRITIDGMDIRKINLSTLRCNIAMVFQEPFLFNGTIRENIAYGRPKATDEEIKRAAVAARVDDFIRNLPQRYETKVGERGVKFSGGERQRIAIARAILKNPSILILDEATSFVDSESSLAIQQALDVLMKDRTSIVIAHRLETILKADNIIVLKDGYIVEVGKHQQLLEKGGIYSRLYFSQFEHEHSNS